MRSIKISLEFCCLVKTFKISLEFCCLVKSKVYIFHMFIFRNVLGKEIFPYHSEYFPHAENLELHF